MNTEIIRKYINRKVLLTLKNGFKYKIFLKEEYINDNTISFKGKFGEPVDIDSSEITFITMSTDEGGHQ